MHPGGPLAEDQPPSSQVTVLLSPQQLCPPTDKPSHHLTNATCSRQGPPCVTAQRLPPTREAEWCPALLPRSSVQANWWKAPPFPSERRRGDLPAVSRHLPPFLFLSPLDRTGQCLFFPLFPCGCASLKIAACNAKWNKNQHQVSFNASIPAVSVAGNFHSQVLFAESGSEIAFSPELT